MRWIWRRQQNRSHGWREPRGLPSTLCEEGGVYGWWQLLESLFSGRAPPALRYRIPPTTARNCWGFQSKARAALEPAPSLSCMPSGRLPSKYSSFVPRLLVASRKVGPKTRNRLDGGGREGWRGRRGLLVI